MAEKNELDSVVSMLTLWVAEVRLRNTVNDTGINRTSENLALRLLNAAYDYNLTNLNWKHNNKEAVDLGDFERGIAFQVTATGNLDKIRDTINKFYAQQGPFKEFPRGLFFFFLKEKPPSLKAKTKQNLQKIAPGFDPDQRMWSMKTLLTKMEELYSVDRLRFNKVKNILEEEFDGKSMEKKVGLTNQPKSMRPEAWTPCRLHQIDQPQDFLKVHLSSIMDAGIAKYCPEKHQLYLQFNLDDPESFERLKSLSLSQFKQPKKKSNSGNKKQIKILTSEERKLLGLLAVSTVPLKISYFARCFPDKDWKKQFKTFIRDGLLQRGSDEICISKIVRENLLSDPHETRVFHQVWIETLEPIKHYIDIPLHLALHYMALERFDDAVMVLTDILIDMEHGWENEIYLSFLEKIAESKILTRINSESRVNFYNIMGLCLSRTGNHLAAIKWFLNLRSYSKRIKHSWGIGQSYINCGYVYFESNELQKAERCYRKAIEHGKTTDDKWLLGRALHNLSMTIFPKAMDNDQRQL